jgi:hypothetical protein
MRTQATKGRSAAGLTATQIIILRNAKAGPVRFYAGDRLGTRCARYDDDGVACIVAYSNPEGFLVRRGLLRPRNERFTYDITDAGREAITRAEAVLSGATPSSGDGNV